MRSRDRNSSSAARDNSVYHKGYPTNYREQGGDPSVQISIAPDGRRADIDVDYRASSFPAALFNGHLTSANSDVRAGNNYDRHINRWTGFQKWWGGLFGVRQDRRQSPDAASRPVAIPTTPRLGKKNIDAMVNDFLTAWLVEGDIVASMGYFSERAYACLARDSDNPADFDRGLAPVPADGQHEGGPRCAWTAGVAGQGRRRRAARPCPRSARSGNRTRRSSSSTRYLTMSPPHSTVKAS